MTESVISRAAKFAKDAHNAFGQVRKYTGEPYWHHCQEVAQICIGSGLDENQIAAAWLHDTVEDCSVSFSDIEVLFNKDIADLVYWLTDVSTPEDGNRETRKTLDAIHISKAPDRAKSVKCADLISNTRSIVERDPDFAKVYMREKARLMISLVGANSLLYKEALKLVLEYKYGQIS